MRRIFERFLYLFVTVVRGFFTIVRGKAQTPHSNDDAHYDFKTQKKTQTTRSVVVVVVVVFFYVSFFVRF